MYFCFFFSFTAGIIFSRRKELYQIGPGVTREDVASVWQPIRVAPFQTNNKLEVDLIMTDRPYIDTGTKSSLKLQCSLTVPLKFFESKNFNHNNKTFSIKDGAKKAKTIYLYYKSLGYDFLPKEENNILDSNSFPGSIEKTISYPIYIFANHQSAVCRNPLTFNLKFLTIVLVITFMIIGITYYYYTNLPVPLDNCYFVKSDGTPLSPPVYPYRKVIQNYLSQHAPITENISVGKFEEIPDYYFARIIPIRSYFYLIICQEAEPAVKINSKMSSITIHKKMSVSDQIEPIDVTATSDFSTKQITLKFKLDQEDCDIVINPKQGISLPCGRHVFHLHYFHQLALHLLFAKDNSNRTLFDKNFFTELIRDVVDTFNYSGMVIYKGNDANFRIYAEFYSDETAKNNMNLYAQQINKNQIIGPFAKTVDKHRLTGVRLHICGVYYMVLASISTQHFVIRSTERAFIAHFAYYLLFNHLLNVRKQIKRIQHFNKLIESCKFTNIFCTTKDFFVKNEGTVCGLKGREIQQLNLPSQQLVNDPKLGWIVSWKHTSFDPVYDQDITIVVTQDLNCYFSLCSRLQTQYKEEIEAMKMFGFVLSGSDWPKLIKELGFPTEKAELPKFQDILHHNDLMISEIKRNSIPTFVKLRQYDGTNAIYLTMCPSSRNVFLRFNDFNKIQSITCDFIPFEGTGDKFAFWCVDPVTDSIFAILSDPLILENHKWQNVSDIISLVQPQDRKVFTENYLLLMKKKSNFVKFNVRMALSDTVRTYSMTIQLSSNCVVFIHTHCFNQSNELTDNLVEMTQLVDIGMLYSNVLVWFFNDESDEERIYSAMPIAHKPFYMNWTTIEMNIAAEDQARLTEQLKATLEGKSIVDIEVPVMFDRVRWCMLRGQRSKKGQVMGILVDLTELKSLSEQAEMQKHRAEEANSAKSRFLANMSHEIRTPLNGMSGLLELLEGTKIPEQSLGIVKCIRTSFTKLLELLNDTLDLAKIDQKKMIPQRVIFQTFDTLLPIILLLEQRTWDTNIKFFVNVDPAMPLLLEGDPHFLARIVNNLISTSLKYTDEGSSEIAFSCENDKVIVHLKDTGIGLLPEEEEVLFEPFPQLASTVRASRGMGASFALMKEMIDLIDGSVSWTTSVNNGMDFRIEIGFPAISNPYIPASIKQKKFEILVLVKHLFTDGIVQQYCDFYGLKLIQKSSQASNMLRLVIFEKNPVNMREVRAIISRYSQTKAILVSPKKVNLKFDDVMVVRLSEFWMKFHEFYIQYVLAEMKKEQETGPSDDFTILVAEDNAMNQLVIQKLLEKMGIKNKIVENGSLAVECLKNGEHFNVVFMDHHMPVMDGPEASREIRKLSNENANIPIIAMTASIMKEDEDECIASGMNDFVSKPVSIPKLTAAVKFAANCPFNKMPHK